MSEYTTAYGARVRTGREVSGATQQDLADRLGMSRSSVANIESGRQASTAEQVIQTAEALGVDPRWLLTGWAPGRPPIVPNRLPRAVAVAVAGELRALADRVEEAS